MPRRKVECAGDFVAHTKSGKAVKVFVFQEYLEMRDLSGTSWDPGFKIMKTSDGTHVNRVAKGQYELVTLFGEKELWSTDPCAP